MKKYIVLLLTILFLSCKSQSQIVNILDYDGRPITDTYYKDINNLLDPYTGTWIYSSGSRYIKMVLTKKIKFYDGKRYEDVIVGGVEYKENGVTKVNTLSYINNTSFVNPALYPIWGNHLFDKNFYPKCPECAANELRLQLTYSEPDKANSGRIVLRKITVNGQEALKMELIAGSIMYEYGTTPPEGFKLPVGNYIFIKQ
ncbi:hypothetical protein QFZ37_002843 [Chryseobacterium ginsenosidimutans]|uniref:DUF6705 family protein n=1 Tax=Chryseobacterium ginsenosidimutans TaxID=687846 RepID=UPI002785469C|nr:DUF6705 family protein [Chryseobacterium ginsenosidimutans]MDQ0594474.1 hypothetical protein [Chryseobacterium ginsenosidimutans]